MQRFKSVLAHLVTTQFMLDPVLDNIYAIAAVVIAGLAVARFYYGPRFNEIPWQPLRRVIIPVAHTIAKRKLGEDYYAAYDVDPREHVITIDTLTPELVIDRLEDADYLVEPLASVKTDWNGTTEAASYARHRGSKPFPGAPEWLRERQVHVTLFETSDGGTIVTAHEEYNSWRWDRVEEHYRGETLDVEKGRKLAAADLDVPLEDYDDTHES